MDWKTLKNEITEIYPFLAKARLGFKEGTKHFPLPPFLAIGSYAAINSVKDDSAPKRLAMVFPHSESVACHIAAASALNSIRNQTDTETRALPELKPDEKVLLDGVDYNFLGEVIEKGIRYFKFSYLEKGTTKLLPVTSENRLRIQHSISGRQPTKRDKFPIDSVLDPLLGIKLRGNTSLFQMSVILISRVNTAREQVSNLSIAAENNVCSKLANVFGWGSLTEEGTVKIWGRVGRREEPLVLVSSNFADVCEYLEYNSHKTELIIVDGASYLKDLASFETLLGKDIPILFVLSGKDQDGIQYLKKKDFAFWAWNSEDLKYLCHDDSETEESPFYGLRRKIASFASFGVETVECRNLGFERAFDVLNRVRREVTDEDYHATQILDRMFAFFLRVSRLVSITDSITAKSEKELLSIESDLQTFRFNVHNFLASFAEIVDSFKEGIALLSQENSKPARLRSEIGKMLSAGSKKICVVLSKSDFQTEREYLATRLPGNKVVYERNASFKMRDDYEGVILCGYLKRNQMLRIFDEALNANLTVLNYTHENEWTNSVKKQFFGAFDKHDFRNHSVFGKKLPMVTATELQVAVEDAPATPALEEFEIKLNEFKRQRILKSINEDSGGNKVSARCVTFNQGSFAFLTESYSVPVINELLGGKTKVEKIPQKKVKDILPGDFLLFRESGGKNLIREIADSLLSKNGKGDLRNKALSWREALKRIYEQNAESLSKVKAELKKQGCDRNELTIKNWLNDENQIAPGEDEDILAIAAAANDDELLKNYDDLIGAVSQVRGAHLTAANQIARLLEKRVKGDLSELSESNAEIKVSGLGKVFIVCVESIDSLTVEVPGHKANRMLKEKEREDGANDSAPLVV